MSKKVLLGSEVAEIIKDRQARVVRSSHVKPKLAIIKTNNSHVTDLYLRIKQTYADDIGAEVEIVETTDETAVAEIQKLNARKDIHGIIVQLPLSDTYYTDAVLGSVAPEKDVDGLTPDSTFDPATPSAILWLLAAYNVDLRGKKVLVVGQGRLVGAPLTKMLQNSGVEVVAADETTTNLYELCQAANVIVTATGSPRLIKNTMVPIDAIIVDAGTATDNGEVVGDVSEDVREREDVILTPKKGGVGPLTVAALFENLLRASSKVQE